MLIALSVTVIILAFSLTPFVIAAHIDADIFSGVGNMKLTLFGIPVFKAKLNIESRGTLEKDLVISSGKKREEIHLNANKDDDKSIISLFHTLPIMSYIIVERFDVNANVGLKNNAFATTMTVGVLRAVLVAVTSFLSNRQHIDIIQRVTPEYNSDRLDFELFGIIKLSLANIINSFMAGIMSKLKVKAESNGKRSLRYELKVKE